MGLGRDPGRDPGETEEWGHEGSGTPGHGNAGHQCRPALHLTADHAEVNPGNLPGRDQGSAVVAAESGNSLGEEMVKMGMRWTLAVR